MMERWKQLANGGRQALTESAGTRATLMHKVQGADGLTYGILQESSHFFLKNTTKTVNEAQSADFDYIGGSQNILAERFTSAADAHRRLNAKLYSLRESFGAAAQPDQESELLNKLNQKDDAEATAPEAGVPAEGGVPAPDADPLAGLEAGAPAEAPAPEADPAATPAPDAGAAPDAAAAAPAPDAGGAEAPAPEAGGAEDGAADGMGAGDGLGDENAEGGEGGEDGEGAAGDVMKALGKLGNLIRTTDVSPELALTILNTDISNLKSIIPQIGDDEIEKLQQRLSKDGKQIDEETPRSLSAAHQNSAAEHRKNASDPNNGYRNSEIAAAKDDIEGSAFNRNQAKPLPENIGGPDDSAYHNWDQQASQGSEGVPSFDQFMQSGGFDNSDESVIKGIEAFSKKLWEMDAQASPEDLQAMAKEVNPYIWSKLGNVSEDIINGLAQVAGVDLENNGEWPASQQTGQALLNKPNQAPLNEGSIAALARLLVRAEITKSKK